MVDLILVRFRYYTLDSAFRIHNSALFKLSLLGKMSAKNERTKGFFSHVVFH